ncbi:hypothetical protein A2803_02080 [Candidatus Woesebacteria bacterium RIFCSPHIGHO2_01_FULL_44_21]|uniref:Uncharacterized protein n=1 Tax=Candidatus Woesebacteria bacterium RIFCSPHIGHO2_01_FULL_44_21 TaxID=1802503 RepID=A0A1F7Z0Q8_9BACT|nr:MAG: hypothetical protein A2803_02080 [Candidatus Woesebacteria bacterium RIFCSPHIGHO2_01_FULL_44_21]OGM70720.1 MAG: hypothetical protein A2897_00075 [Candidatus Woesebacteria bacterium RIFCSPLOWO2_01_FULL_44_24b]
MRKALTYSTFAIAGLMVVFVFLTAKSYAQLAGASLLYIPLAVFAYGIFQHNRGSTGREVTVQVPIPQPRQVVKMPNQPVTEKTEKDVVVDLDKRTFLKLIGAIGLTFFVSSLFGRRAENLLFQGGATPSDGGQPGGTLEGLPDSGYQISEIDESDTAYYGFTRKNGNWLIMKEDPETGSFRYTKNESDFPGNWANRDVLEYDYYHNIF